MLCTRLKEPCLTPFKSRVREVFLKTSKGLPNHSQHRTSQYRTLQYCTFYAYGRRVRYLEVGTVWKSCTCTGTRTVPAVDGNTSVNSAYSILYWKHKPHVNMRFVLPGTTNSIYIRVSKLVDLFLFQIQTRI